MKVVRREERRARNVFQGELLPKVLLDEVLRAMNPAQVFIAVAVGHGREYRLKLCA